MLKRVGAEVMAMHRGGSVFERVASWVGGRRERGGGGGRDGEVCTFVRDADCTILMRATKAEILVGLF